MKPERKEDMIRPVANFPKDIWGDQFLHHTVDNKQMEEYAKQIDLLKAHVRDMLEDDSLSIMYKLGLIDIVKRLGLSYHFEKEIDDQLKRIFDAYTYENTYDLYTTSVHFRVFRQHGHRMPCDVFDKFKNIDGRLDQKLRSDVKGILSFFEAAHLRMHNEEFLDESLDSVTLLLTSLASDQSFNLNDPCLYEQVVHATKQPLHTGIPRVETSHFISIYEEDISRDETLLRLAKLDFNMLQLIHRAELSEFVRWWKGLGIKEELPYARDRSTECYFGAMAIHYEGRRCSKARLFMGKVYSMITLLDDTYDAHGTIEELRLLTQAFERWDKSAMYELPGKMKVVFKHVYNVYDEIEREMEKEGREYAARQAKERALDLIRSYHAEAEWAHEGYVPSFEEYMHHAGIALVGQIVPATAMLKMEPEITDEKAFDWIVNPVPRVIRACEIIGRLINDIASHQEEQERGIHVVSAVECYMNEHGVSESEAIAKLHEMIRDAWKDMNEELVKRNHPVSHHIINVVLNQSRLVNLFYNRGIDGFTHSELVMKDAAIKVYVESFSL